MYHVHTTAAFVLNLLPSGEKHHFVTLFTREFGMIRARAQSVRVADSKLRYALQEYSYAEVSLVKGKEIWRITNALPIYNIYFELNSLPAVIPAEAGIQSENADLSHEYFSTEKSLDPDSTRQSPSLRPETLPSSPREYPRMTNKRKELDGGVINEKRDLFMVIARIFSLLKRLVPEEGCESLIFNDIDTICKNVQTDKLSKKTVGTLEWLFILRMLYFLGYLHKESFGLLCEDKIEWTNEYLESIASNKEGAVFAINRALTASQL